MATAAILSSVLSLIHSAETSSSCSFITTKQELNQLKGTLLRIQLLIGDAEKKEIQGTSVHQWLKELRVAAYDAEDALDAYHFHLLSQSKEEIEKVRSPPYPQYYDEIVSRINSARERLDEMAVQSESLGLREGPLDPTTEPSPTESLNNEEIVVFGRDDSKKRLVEVLLMDHECDLSVIPIVGSGGVGKSKLAQIAYNDPLVCEHFDDRLWVCVSDDFSPMRLMGTIVASLTYTPVFYPEADHLQVMVRQLLEGKRFLLVLDDVHNNDRSLWESFRDSLTVGLVGSVVLVTTRDESVARMMQTVPIYHLNCLSEEDSWSLMQHCVSVSSQVPNPELTLIRKGITKKLGGLPLAVRLIGRLSSVNSEEILHELHTDLCNFEPNEGFDMFPSAIALSYLNLRSHLKRCFLYCALFPKYYLFKKDKLVRLWMAEGLIQPVKGKRDEDVGIQYFDELLRRSFFHFSENDQETFLVHSLIHDFALLISKSEVCRVDDGNLCYVPSEARYSSLVHQDHETVIQIHSSHEPRALRTFIFVHKLLNICGVSCFSSKSRLHLQLPSDLFTKLACLRTLDLSETDIAELPDSIGELKHLRFLGLSHTRIRILPESVCTLYNLQTLEMQDCNKLMELPRGTKNLTNLRYLSLPRFSGSVPLPQGIGQLVKLQSLSPFYVGYNSPNSVIAELKKLVSLRGELEVGGLQNVTDLESIRGVLNDKEYLTKVVLHSGSRDEPMVLDNFDYSIFGGEVEDSLLVNFFNDDFCIENVSNDAISQNKTEEQIQNLSYVDAKAVRKANKEKILARNKAAERLEVDVFECLRPHNNLEELVIQNYCGVQFPFWIADITFSKLVSITLDNCWKCKMLPPLGQLPYLKHLVIEQLSDLESIDHGFYGHDSTKGFPSLQMLHFRSMYRWSEWLGFEDGVFPCLQELNLNYCIKLRRMPALLPALEKLTMWMCDELTSLPVLPSLNSLELLDCNEKMCYSLSPALLERLQFLKIHKLEDLASFPLHKLSALKELEFSYCTKTKSPCSSLGQKLSNLTSLKILKIHYCLGLCFSQDQQFPSTLQILDIFHCPLIADWCQTYGSNKLGHIRIILDHKEFHLVD